MTYQDAIENLKVLKISEDDNSVGKLKMLTYDIAIEALEKQIPKKPLKSDKTIRYCEVWECHSCGFEWSGRVVDYCYKCGQAIDWEGTE